VEGPLPPSSTRRIGFEIDRHYYKLAQKRISEETSSLFSKAAIHRVRID
jgi:DNA modification methylase